MWTRLRFIAVPAHGFEMMALVVFLAIVLAGAIMLALMSLLLLLLLLRLALAFETHDQFPVVVSVSVCGGAR